MSLFREAGEFLLYFILGIVVVSAIVALFYFVVVQPYGGRLW